MTLLPINLCGDEILRKKVKKVKKVTDETVEFISNMFETMRHADGIGLAANQVGRDEAIIVIDVSAVEGYEKIKPMVFINPKIKKSWGSIEYEEGCLSLPTIRYKIFRPEKILLSYQDTDLEKQEKEFDGILARVIQHETDHLNGILFIDYVEEDDLKEYNESLKKIQERNIEINYLVTKPKIM